jgi:hypothetical protein
MTMPSRPVDYATKADLSELRTEIRADLAELRVALAQQIGDLKAELYRMIITTLLAMTAIFGGLVTILKLFT